eukprot:275339-Rhodomonas_salina.1
MAWRSDSTAPQHPLQGLITTPSPQRNTTQNGPGPGASRCVAAGTRDRPRDSTTAVCVGRAPVSTDMPNHTTVSNTDVEAPNLTPTLARSTRTALSPAGQNTQRGDTETAFQENKQRVSSGRGPTQAVHVGSLASLLNTGGRPPLGSSGWTSTPTQPMTLGWGGQWRMSSSDGRAYLDALGPISTSPPSSVSEVGKEAVLVAMSSSSGASGSASAEEAQGGGWIARIRNPAFRRSFPYPARPERIRVRCKACKFQGAMPEA